jgi:N6-adenosine-specific RNA methylase IME4/ParB-like chromosome segregation protein Spo0J
MSAMRISAITVGARHRRDMGDLAPLAKSIEEIGLLHPIVVDNRGVLIAGERRLQAYKLLGRTEIPVTKVDLAEIARGELDENAIRKDFLPSEIDAIRRTLEPVEKAAARERQAAGKEAPESFGKDRHERETSSRIGAFAGVSGRTVDKIAAVVAAAEAEPERFARLAAAMDRTGRVKGPFKRLQVARQAEAIRAEPPPLPGNGPYHVIVADPPWPFEMRMEDPSHRAIYPYPTMSIAQIAALRVGELAHDDCILWLWTTNFNMREALGLVETWGFQHKTLLTWVKDRFGYGDWLRTQTEHVIFATRGRPIVQLTNESTVLFAPMRAHSEKPDEFYALVEKLCPAPRYCELFSRRARPNWDGHGDEHRPALERAS